MLQIEKYFASMIEISDFEQIDAWNPHNFEASKSIIVNELK